MTRTRPTFLNRQGTNSWRIIHTDSGFFQVFSLPVIAGQQAQFLADPHQAVIIESCSKRIFGEEDAIGRVLNVSHREDVEVVAVVKNACASHGMPGAIWNYSSNEGLRVLQNRPELVDLRPGRDDLPVGRRTDCQLANVAFRPQKSCGITAV